MKVAICAVGRLRAGPERQLLDDYVARFDRTGRGLGLGPLAVQEVEDRKGGGKEGEALLLDKAIPEGTRICALDERGRQMSSPELAQTIAGWRDAGDPGTVFVIGGADGLTADLLTRADMRLSLGPMVWPHMLVRVMLAEQLYRATTILAGGPYHRA
ncbi:23S rRNA (pseudouridine(1915)-N(3))-methyltransferase RlmH [Profundibacterium mesophilum]|uniref:Ribosomal RNA large subunit methyltransferase H n=1 Tax=Profundibacterium mesophilum KAUST100406-0324 TaxID=1037889 RepID=A0A921NRF8_9RHOB|nr:23S rRNA (pseudouridine(1915)-N(3))-methyltransferase RlmH [Profundibacterium mesophilum]KAF0677287.1 Ribosomal RNA large subunit methyltransferase H [Profundibacterium mesophilum KAUST100406-0324]